MIDAPLAIAFATGLVAAVNPCGFAMLPAYIGYFLEADVTEDETPRTAPVLRAIPVSAAVTLGFVAVFGTVGIALRSVSSTVQEYAPYATVVIGVGLVAFGLATLWGFKPNLRLPSLNRGGRSRGLGSMFLFGVSYATASLTCTIGIFIANIVFAFTRTDFISGVAVLVTYALGMGLVITALTLGVALARDSVLKFLRKGMRYVDVAAGALMVVMGGYVIWYGIFALRLRGDITTAGGPVDFVDRWSANASEFVNRVGPARVGLYLAAVIVAIICISVIVSSLRRLDEGGSDDGVTTEPSDNAPTDMASSDVASDETTAEEPRPKEPVL